MKVIIIFISLLLASASPLHAQITSIKSVQATGGGLCQANALSGIVVIGEPVIGDFSTGSLSGRIGYLNDDDAVFLKVGETKPSVLTVKIFPNPNAGHFTATLDLAEPTEIHLQLTDITGRTLIHKYLPAGVGQASYEFHDTPPGAWLLTIVAGSYRKVEKIIVAGQP